MEVGIVAGDVVFLAVGAGQSQEHLGEIDRRSLGVQHSREELLRESRVGPLCLGEGRSERLYRSDVLLVGFQLQHKDKSGINPSREALVFASTQFHTLRISRRNLLL